MLGVGNKDEGFDGVGDVIGADAEVNSDQVECGFGGLTFASLDSLQVAGGDAGCEGQSFLVDAFGFADDLDGLSDYFAFAHRKKLHDMRRNAQVVWGKDAQKYAST